MTMSLTLPAMCLEKYQRACAPNLQRPHLECTNGRDSNVYSTTIPCNCNCKVAQSGRAVHTSRSSSRRSECRIPSAPEPPHRRLVRGKDEFLDVHERQVLCVVALLRDSCSDCALQVDSCIARGVCANCAQCHINWDWRVTLKQHLHVPHAAVSSLLCHCAICVCLCSGLCWIALCSDCVLQIDRCITRGVCADSVQCHIDWDWRVALKQHLHMPHAAVYFKNLILVCA